ncbi:MAG: hypothetical protein Q9175_001901 [Cornicularia normoerica]
MNGVSEETQQKLIAIAALRAKIASVEAESASLRSENANMRTKLGKSRAERAGAHRGVSIPNTWKRIPVEMVSRSDQATVTRKCNKLGLAFIGVRLVNHWPEFVRKGFAAKDWNFVKEHGKVIVEAVAGRQDLADWFHNARNEDQQRVALGHAVVTKADAGKLGDMAQEKVTMD